MAAHSVGTVWKSGRRDVGGLKRVACSSQGMFAARITCPSSNGGEMASGVLEWVREHHCPVALVQAIKCPHL